MHATKNSNPRIHLNIHNLLLHCGANEWDVGDDLLAPVLRRVVDRSAAVLPHGHHGAGGQGGPGADRVSHGVDRRFAHGSGPVWFHVGTCGVRFIWTKSMT